MWRILWILALGGILGMGGKIQAQPGPNKDEVRKLEANLDKLREQIKDLEARLQRVKESSKGDFKKDFKGFGPGAKWDPEKMKELREQFEKKWKEGQRGSYRGGFGRPGGPPFGPKGFDPKGPGPKGPPPGPGSEIERRLDRIVQEIEAIRKEIKKK